MKDESAELNPSESFPARLYRSAERYSRHVPSHEAARRFADRLTELLFPVRSDHCWSLPEVEKQWAALQNDFASMIRGLCPPQVDCRQLADRFFDALPAIHSALMDDAQMYRDSDPASGCVEEVILCYPGFYAVMVHRIAHVIHSLGVPILPRIIAEYAHSRTGIDIHPGAQIGPRFYIDHGTGVVIGQTTVIGTNVCLYQGVTLGALYVDKELRGVRRHPTIQDNVVIYAGSTILGGNTVVGHDTVIGGNVWLTESVPPFSRVYHKPEIEIKTKQK